jgi:hypothetical protein
VQFRKELLDNSPEKKAELKEFITMAARKSFRVQTIRLASALEEQIEWVKNEVREHVAGSAEEEKS